MGEAEQSVLLRVLRPFLRSGGASLRVLEGPGGSGIGGKRRRVGGGLGLFTLSRVSDANAEQTETFDHFQTKSKKL